jgi:hypothetical protein
MGSEGSDDDSSGRGDAAAAVCPAESCDALCVREGEPSAAARSRPAVRGVVCVAMLGAKGQAAIVCCGGGAASGARQAEAEGRA